MSKRDSKPTPDAFTMNLDKLCAGGSPSDVIDDSFVDDLVEWIGRPDAVDETTIQNAVAVLRAVIADEGLVVAIRGKRTDVTEQKSLGQLMNEVRTQANWDLATVARKLRSQTSVVDRMERDLIPIGDLTAQQCADILEVFRIRLREFGLLVRQTCRAQELVRKVGTAFARSKTDPNSAQHGRELSFALLRGIPGLVSTSSEPVFSEGKQLDDIAQELRNRQRFDLLVE